MKTRVSRTNVPGLLLAWLAVVSFATAAPKVDFNREIRPLLSDNCFPCHGPDAKKMKAGLRLDVRDIATKPLKSGETAIVPGKPEASELVRRIFATDSDDLMPPTQSHKTLTTAQRELLKRWIAEGAEYRGHWAYELPKKANVPTGENPVDYLVRARLKESGLKPAPEAERRILVRRLHFDLVGLPPKPEEVTAFERDLSPEAYQKLVARLLASPNYGERMAIGWLDVVRFADTIGYHSDNPRNIWPYRDYVIRAFNENKPFDQFTREQLAGDLLPNSGLGQKVASGFNRLLLTTEEGGAQPKDYEARQLTDRVRAVGAVWLGQTIGCAQCHDHKFDPITSRDFYSLGAFFADVKEAAIGRREDGMFVPTEAQARELANHEQEVTLLQQEFNAPHPELADGFARWEKAQLAALVRAEQEKTSPPEKAKLEDEANVDDRVKAAELVKDTKPPAKELARLLKIPATERDAKQRASLFAHFKEQAPELANLRNRLATARKARTDFEAKVPRTLITERTIEPRTVRILPRGDWMIETGEIVEPAFPAFLTQAGNDASGQKLNRLDLANWLLSRDNPLTARVVMNRLWKQFFGMGLSKVLDDLGAQGEPPPNQELLDWLACEFRDSGWNMKHMVRLIVNSATYRQTSVATREQLERDPENRLLARQGRWRLDAELVRDNALALAGLLDPTIGGPSARPYQPDGYWENLNFPPRTYEASRGADQYRRGLYTWWQRSFLHPSLVAFDAPSREECAAERACSNIPQQALVLLNDPTYVEAARAFAVRILHEATGDETARIAWAWRQALSRTPQAKEVATLRALLEKHRGQYQQNKSAAEAFLKVGNAPPPADLDVAELAAWTNVARVILNLHETITRS
jgi:mono/diheme cytochrome c family protein